MKVTNLSPDPDGRTFECEVKVKIRFDSNELFMWQEIADVSKSPVGAFKLGLSLGGTIVALFPEDKAAPNTCGFASIEPGDLAVAFGEMRKKMMKGVKK